MDIFGIIFGFLAVGISVLMLVGWVMNIVKLIKLFQSSESKPGMVVLRSVGIIVFFIGSIVGFLA